MSNNDLWVCKGCNHKLSPFGCGTGINWNIINCTNCDKKTAILFFGSFPFDTTKSKNIDFINKKKPDKELR